jgi:DNA-binding transcriptional regulator PaaX
MRIKHNGGVDIILRILESAVDGMVKFNDFASNAHIYAKGYDRPLKKTSLQQAISRLIKKGMIERVKVGDEIVIQLIKSRNLIIKKQTLNWDGKWRVIIFDIPEQKRVVRNLFRRNLKRWGFKNLQRSVWITKQDCFEDLARIIRELDIEQYVSILQTDKIFPDPH